MSGYSVFDYRSVLGDVKGLIFLPCNRGRQMTPERRTEKWLLTAHTTSRFLSRWI